MKIIALEREVAGVTEDQFEPHLKAEALRVWELQQHGVLREIYFRADRSDAVLVLECLEVDEAEQVLSSLPLVEAGLIAFEIIPLRPYDGLTRLFEGGS